MANVTTQPEDRIADEIACDCLAGRVRLLGRAITAIYDEALRPLGVTAGQLNAIVVVAKRGPVAPGTLARHLGMDKSTLSRNLERMRTHGWIKVSPGESGNGQLVQLAAKGRTVLKNARPLWRGAQKNAERLLGARGMDSVRKACDTVVSKSAAP